MLTSNYALQLMVSLRSGLSTGFQRWYFLHIIMKTNELAALKEHEYFLVSSDYCAAVEDLANLMKDKSLSVSVAKTAKAKLKYRGVKTLACEEQI